jgi:hypothetical protein
MKKFLVYFSIGEITSEYSFVLIQISGVTFLLCKGDFRRRYCEPHFAVAKPQ